MPKYRVETVEAMPTRRVFEIEADDASAAIEIIRDGEYEPANQISDTPEPGVNWTESSGDLQFISVMPADLPLAAWKAMGQPVRGPISEAEHLLIRERMGRPANPPVVEIRDEPAPEPKPQQELKRMANDLPRHELERLVSVIQKFLWWDKANDSWNRDLPPSLDTLDFIADVLERAGLRPAEIIDDNP